METDPETYLKNAVQLATDLGRGNQMVWTGIAPHSVRAVPIDYMKEIVRFANERTLPVHMHVAEQPAEVSACIEEYGRSPVALLATEGLLSERFTAVHSIHVTPKAVRRIADANAMVCACPTTERNLGDGVIPVDSFFEQGVRVALGTDSHVQIDLLEDARELEYHLRLQRLERNVLAPEATTSLESNSSALAARLFDCATCRGAESIGAQGGELEPGRPADFLTVDLDDPSIAGASVDDLLSAIVFSLARTAVREVFVGGQAVIDEGRHRAQREIVENFAALQQRLWS